MSLLTRRLKPYYEELLDPLVNFFGKYRVSPNLVTLSGFAFVCIGSFFLYKGSIFPAFIFLLLGALADSVDGAIARRLNLKTDFGAFLDSTVDRFSDALPFTALGVHYASYGDEVGVFLSFSALISSFGVSYTRARAESLGVYGLGGAFERTERWVVLLGSVLLGLFKLGLFIITVGSLITVFQRVLATKKALEVKR